MGKPIFIAPIPAGMTVYPQAIRWHRHDGDYTVWNNRQLDGMLELEVRSLTELRERRGRGPEARKYAEGLAAIVDRLVSLGVLDAARGMYIRNLCVDDSLPQNIVEQRGVSPGIQAQPAPQPVVIHVEPTPITVSPTPVNVINNIDTSPKGDVELVYDRQTGRLDGIKRTPAKASA